MRNPLFVFLYVGLLALTAGCAVQGQPEGGDKDTTPPQVISSEPENRSIHFSANEVVLEFDEYIKVDNFKSQFISSPPLKYPVDYTLRKKSLYIEFEDTLRPNTTYTFSFGNAIKDITENNVQSEFKFVFSTGAVLDSQRVSGNVYDAFSTDPEKNIMVALYPADAPDSALSTERPLYYALTNEKGEYSIENISPAEYRLFAVQDRDFNYIWSGPSEKLGFTDELVQTIDNPSIDIPTFKPEAEYRFYRGKYADFGRVELYFSKPAHPLEIERLDTNTSTFFIEAPEDGDTLNLWTTDFTLGRPAYWQMYHPASGTTDSIKVPTFTKDTTRFKLEWTNKPPFSPTDSITLKSTTPILSIDSSKVHLYLHDTIPVPFRIEHSSVRGIKLRSDFDYRQRLLWVIDSAAVTDLFGRVNDSLGFEMRIMEDTDLAIFHMKVQSDLPGSKVLELFTDKGVVFYRSSFTSELNVDLWDIRPQTIKARIIDDRNADGRWNPGNFDTHTQPERVIYLDKKIELRANWEIDETWVIQ